MIMWTEEQKARKIRTAEGYVDTARQSLEVARAKHAKRVEEEAAAVARVDEAARLVGTRTDLLREAERALTWARSMPTIGTMDVEESGTVEVEWNGSTRTVTPSQRAAVSGTPVHDDVAAVSPKWTLGD